MDFTAVDKRIAALEATRAKPCKVSPTEPLAVGLDLGTAYIVLAVVDSRQRPVACAVQSAQVVRDGLVVDYAGGLLPGCAPSGNSWKTAWAASWEKRP